MLTSIAETLFMHRFLSCSLCFFSWFCFFLLDFLSSTRSSIWKKVCFSNIQSKSGEAFQAWQENSRLFSDFSMQYFFQYSLLLGWCIIIFFIHWFNQHFNQIFSSTKVEMVEFKEAYKKIKKLGCFGQTFHMRKVLKRMNSKNESSLKLLEKKVMW